MAFDQATIFKIVHGYGGSGCIARGFISDLRQGHRRIEQPPQYAYAAEGQAGGIADFAAPFTPRFPHQGDQRLPDAIGFAAAVGLASHPSLQ